MLYYIIRHVEETREKNEALREIRRNGWRCPYIQTSGRHWRLCYGMKRSLRRR